MDRKNIGESSKAKGKGKTVVTTTTVETPVDAHPIRFAPPRPVFSPPVSTALRLGIGGSSQSTPSNHNTGTNARPDFPSAAFRPPLYSFWPNTVQGPGFPWPPFIPVTAQVVQRNPVFMRNAEEELAVLRAEMRNVLQRANLMSEDNRTLRRRITELERRVTELTQEEEEAESTSGDPTRLEPIMLECKMCARRRAVVMLLPCSHLCVCRVCDLITRRCPVCGFLKNGSSVVQLP